MITPEIVTVHLSQTGFVANLIKENNIHHCSITHDATPYRSDLPIDAIAESDEDNKCPTFSSANKNTKALLALLDGSHKAHGRICHRLTRFFPLIATSPRKAT
jgi:hypothetical protein